MVCRLCCADEIWVNIAISDDCMNDMARYSRHHEPPERRVCQHLPLTACGSPTMGTTHVDLKLTTRSTRKAVTVSALVDTGTTHPIVTPAVARELGFDLDEVSTYRLTVADGRRTTCARIVPVPIELLDRDFTTEAAVLGDECLVGCIPLEAMDLV